MIQTLCPSCGTAFRVTPEQLKARGGKVRCGKCQQVFNAIETLREGATEPATPAEAQPEFSAMEQVPAEIPADTSLEETLSMGAEPEAEDAWEEVPPEEESEAPPRRRAWPWLLVSLLALLVLLLQAIVQFRVELSVLSPDMKPLLLALCQPLDCDLPLPRKSDLISIEASDLHPDPRDKEHLLLAATIKNRAPFAQAYPHLELTLTDIADKPMLRRVLAPADYLAGEPGVAAGLAANGEIAVHLVLSYDHADGSAASGYRLYLFYP